MLPSGASLSVGGTLPFECIAPLPRVTRRDPPFLHAHTLLGRWLKAHGRTEFVRPNGQSDGIVVAPPLHIWGSLH